MKVKKLILLFILFVLIFFPNCSKPTRTDLKVQEDIEYFKTIFENCYVFYDELYEKKPFKIDIKKLFKNYKKAEKKFKEEKITKNIENGISQEALMNTILWFLKRLEPEDNHLCLYTNDSHYFISDMLYLYSSNYYFNKIGDDFILSNSPEKKLIGSKFTGNYEDIKKTVKDKQEIYLFAPTLKTYEQKEGTILLDGKEYKIPLQMEDHENNREDVIKILNTNETLYIKCNTFNIVEGSEEEMNFETGLDEIKKRLENKKYIILDLRGNTGGYTYYSQELIAAIYGIGDDELEKNRIIEFLDTADYGIEYLQSELLFKMNYERLIQDKFPQEYIDRARNEYEDFINSGKQRGLVKSTAEPSRLPEFKGKKQNAKIIVLTDYITASASEYCIGYLYMMDKNNVILAGYNTAGTMAGGGVFKYELPNSKVEVKLCCASNKKTVIYKFIDSWKGDNNGFYPDYWVMNNNFAGTVIYLTNDKDLNSIIPE